MSFPCRLFAFVINLKDNDDEVDHSCYQANDLSRVWRYFYYKIIESIITKHRETGVFFMSENEKKRDNHEDRKHEHSPNQTL